MTTDTTTPRRRHNPAWKDSTNAKRQAARREKLDAAAQVARSRRLTCAERKAGELLQQLERAPHDRGNQHVAKFQPGIQPESEYRAHGQIYNLIPAWNEVQSTVPHLPTLLRR